MGTKIDYDSQMVELAAPIRMASNNDRRWQEIGKQEDGAEGKMRRIDRAELCARACVCACVCEFSIGRLLTKVAAFSALGAAWPSH